MFAVLSHFRQYNITSLQTVGTLGYLIHLILYPQILRFQSSVNSEINDRHKWTFATSFSVRKST